MTKALSKKTLGIIHSTFFTAAIVQPFLDELLPEAQVLHFADDSIQRDNLAAEVGTIPKNSFFKFTTYAHFLQEAGADLIMLGCSTFNQAVEFARPMITTPMLQIDRPMMDLAVQTGERIGLLTTLPSTIPASERLLRQAAREAGRNVEIKTVLCAGAFQMLRQGNSSKHNELLLEEIEKLIASVDCICMAQISMSILERSLTGTKVPVLNSGRTGFAKAREILESLTEQPTGGI
jgi:Asp/Glu/hydantoin racemase